MANCTPAYNQQTRELMRRRDELARVAKGAEKGDFGAAIRAKANEHIDAGDKASDVLDKTHEFINKYAPHSKEEVSAAITGSKKVAPTKTAAAKQRAAIKAELRDLEKIAKGQPTGKKSPEEIANTRRQTQLRKQLDELNRRQREGDYSKPGKREPPNYSDDTRLLQSQVNHEKKLVDRLMARAEAGNKSKIRQSVDYAQGWMRQILLTSSTVLAKLSAAASLRIGIAPVEEAAGGILSHIPGIKGIAAKAPSEGGFSLNAEKKALGNTFSKQTLLTDTKNIMLKGESALEALYDHKPLALHTHLEISGRMHQSLKNPAKVNAFNRSLTKRIEFEIRQMQAKGMSEDDITTAMASPLKQDELGGLAYADALRAVFAQKNWVSSAWESGLATLEKGGGFPNAVAALMRFVMPITKVPTNLTGEVVGEYALGGPRALTQLVMKGGTKKLTGAEADTIMRLLKKQSIGASLLAIGYMGYQGFKAGGYYQQGDNKRNDIQEAGTLEIGGVKIDKNLVHNPAMELLQIGANIARMREEGKGYWETAYGTGKGILESNPFFEQPMEIAEAGKTSKSATVMAGSLLASRFLPSDIRRTAEYNDQSSFHSPQDHNPVEQYMDAGYYTNHRKPQDFLDAVRASLPGHGIPGIGGREDVPENSPRAPRHRGR